MTYHRRRKYEKYKREIAWVRKKLAAGVSKQELLNCVGIFTNKKKEKIMQEKNINQKQYKERYKFLGNVYFLLNSDYLKNFSY